MLQLDEERRSRLWSRLIDVIETYAREVKDLPVSPEGDMHSHPLKGAANIRTALEAYSFESRIPADGIIDFVAGQLSLNQVHTSHPSYYGLFNPCPTTMGIAADTLVAAFNPQLATFNHSPFAVAVEQHLVRLFGERFGYKKDGCDGTFTTGGAEANHTALLCALTAKFPDYGKKGARGLAAQPVLYVSTESHHSLLKAARLCGLGTDSVREVPTDSALRMDVAVLKTMIENDRKSGLAPFFVVSTAGTTNGGTIDLLQPVAEICRANDLWLHVDAAWGGAAVLVPELRPLLKGIEDADSITFDCHKWLSVPMAAGLFLTREKDILDRTFRVAATYMPQTGSDGAVDPYAHSMQWSRRFIGLKVFMSLAECSWEGYAIVLRHQTAMGERLRQGLKAHGWTIVNDTPLPIVCFTPQPDMAASLIDEICRRVVASGTAWISTTRVAADIPVLRACITNYKTSEQDVDGLIGALNQARAASPTSRAGL